MDDIFKEVKAVKKIGLDFQSKTLTYLNCMLYNVSVNYIYCIMNMSLFKLRVAVGKELNLGWVGVVNMVKGQI